MKCFNSKLLIYTLVSTTLVTTTTTLIDCQTRHVESCFRPQQKQQDNGSIKKALDERLERFSTFRPIMQDTNADTEPADASAANEFIELYDDENAAAEKASKKKIRQRLRKKRRRNKKKQPIKQTADLLLATPLQLPTITPTKKYHHYIKPPKSNLFKKKKQEYLSHLGYVFLPFVKFITFFTVLNPFTLAVFFFMLISPVVFALLGFTALSLILRPVMHLLFAVKHRVNTINQRKRRYQTQHKHKTLTNKPTPITIHKHYYALPATPKYHVTQKPLIWLPKRSDPAQSLPTFIRPNNRSLYYNPILPQVQHQLKYVGVNNLL